MSSISVIGAGIGGLTTALFLKNKGISHQVFEAAPAIEPVGAGIGLGNNAMQIFHLLGIGGEIEAAGHKVNYMRITDEKLRNLSLINLHHFEQKYGVHNLAIHRAGLQHILARNLGEEKIYLGKRLAEIKTTNQYKLSFSDGSHFETEGLIGADGIKSVVRQQLFGKQLIRPAGQVCWRGLCSFNGLDRYAHQAIEAWGRGRRFGFVYLNSTTLYWYAVADEKTAAEHQHRLSLLFKDFHTDIQEMIEMTPEKTIILGPLADLKPFSGWHAGNACLIGDAAHATTPNMGQGACQAIEDAYALGSLLGSGDMAAAFGRYEQLRIKKAHQIVKRSRMIGNVSHWKNATGIAIRNWIMKKTPAKMNIRQLEPVFDMSYISSNN
ncbi:FAD-dependent monooxygenase [Niabella hibiscisoli]|uniref:FAD-dependent monooxygenase n=1 Tax=Niabella hibiscisoli TaxID=1825928 RepID=UPI001F10C69B|nr:FAD-dependent monooxygenase [Niabella hibiscisoli]MCH5715757.1 FAD-dependent monooxygenase [Niabella hibiscisoli]